MLGQHRGDVRVMVLHRDRGGSPLQRDARGEIARVQVVRRRPPARCGTAGAKRASVARKCSQRLEVLEIADVRAHAGRVAVHQRERVLEVRPDGQQWDAGSATGSRSGQRRVAARPPQDDAARRRPTRTTESSYARDDLAVVQEEASAIAAQPLRAPRRCRRRSAPRSDCRWSSPAAGRPPRAAGWWSGV